MLENDTKANLSAYQGVQHPNARLFTKFHQVQIKVNHFSIMCNEQKPELDLNLISLQLNGRTGTQQGVPGCQKSTKQK